MDVRLKRVYDTPAGGDALRVLVDRVWPRDMTGGKPLTLV